MAEPILPDDFLANIADLERRLFILESTGRVPQVSSLDRGIKTATVAGASSRTSSVYGDLADGVGPSLTVQVGQLGRLLVMTSHYMLTGNTDTQGYMDFAISGASSRSPSDATASTAFIFVSGAGVGSFTMDATPASIVLVQGLNPGAHTVTAKYRGVNNTIQTGRFSNRTIVAVPL